MFHLPAFLLFFCLFKEVFFTIIFAAIFLLFLDELVYAGADVLPDLWQKTWEVILIAADGRQLLRSICFHFAPFT
jgi:hypothetical protein